MGNRNIADLLCTLVREQVVPQVTIEPFDGNPFNFPYFLSLFAESVGKKIEGPMERLARLIKYTTWEAQEFVKHFINDKLEQGYRNAMELLRRQYGNPHRLVAVYRTEIKQMSPIKPGDISAFKKLFNFLIKCQSLSRSSDNNPLNTPEIICMIFSYFPVHLQGRWNRNTLKMRTMRSRGLQLFDLATFVEDEMTLLSDPLYSRDTVSQYIEKNQKVIKSKRFTANTVKAEGLGKVDISKKLKVGNRCPVCNENHDNEDCVFFLQQTLEERSKLLYKRKLCYGCFEEVTMEHNAKSWANQRICKV